MLESPAWRALHIAARKVIDRIMIENIAHSGGENGALIVTYSNFESFGIRRRSIADAIDEAEALGFIDVVDRGGASYADLRRPSRYGLTWLDRKDGTPATNRWQKHATLIGARAAARLALTRPQKQKASGENAPGASGECAPDARGINAPGRRRKPGAKTPLHSISWSRGGRA